MLSDALVSLDPVTLEPPESRIGTIAGVRSRISELKAGDRERGKRRATVQSLIDGNAPYLENEMIEAGRADDANINFRQAEGRVAAATTPYYELAFGVPRAADIELYFGDNDQRNFEWSESLSDRYSELLWGWPGYKINLQTSNYQMTVHGRGPIIRDTKRGWHFKARKDESILVADDAMCDLKLLEEMAIPGHFEPVELFKKIDRDQEFIKNWNIDMAKRAIINAAPEALKSTYGDVWSSYQASLRRGDVSWNNKASRIFYTDYLVKEFTGKISHCIVLDDASTNKGQEDDFVFKKMARFDAFSEIINPFFFDVGPDGLWYSVKGLGPKIFDECDLENRFYCTMINGAMASCGIPLQAQNATAMQKIQQTPLVRASGITFIPPDWTVQQIQMRGALNDSMAVVQQLHNLTSVNTGQYRQRAGEQNQEPTLGQAQMNAAEGASLSRGAYDRWYHYADDMHLENIRRILDPNLTETDSGGKEAKEMLRKLVEEDGVPKEALVFKNICSVKAVRNVGYGSPQMQQVVSQKLMALLGTMDEEGRQNALRSNGASLVGQSHVGRFWKKFEDLGIPNDQEAWATFENNILRQPDAQLAVTPAQNAPLHFTVHSKDAMAHLQQMQQGQADPKAVLVHLDNVGPHLHLHLQAMEGDPTREAQYQQMQKAWVMLAKMTDQLKAQVANAQPDQQQPQVDPQHLQDLMKIMTDAKTKHEKMQLDEARKDKKLQGDIQRKDLQTSSDIMRKNAESVSQNGQAGPQMPAVQSPPPKVSQSMNYKDAGPFIRRQMEAAEGYVPDMQNTDRLPPPVDPNKAKTPAK